MMYASDSSRGHVERDPRNDKRQRADEGAATEGRRTVNDPRSRTREDEVVIDRKPIVADRQRDEEDAWPTAPADRRRTERRRIERMGTDI